MQASVCGRLRPIEMRRLIKVARHKHGDARCHGGHHFAEQRCDFGTARRLRLGDRLRLSGYETVANIVRLIGKRCEMHIEQKGVLRGGNDEAGHLRSKPV